MDIDALTEEKTPQELQTILKDNDCKVETLVWTKCDKPLCNRRYTSHYQQRQSEGALKHLPTLVSNRKLAILSGRNKLANQKYLKKHPEAEERQKFMQRKRNQAQKDQKENVETWIRKNNVFYILLAIDQDSIADLNEEHVFELLCNQKNNLTLKLYVGKHTPQSTFNIGYRKTHATYKSAVKDAYLEGSRIFEVAALGRHDNLSAEELESFYIVSKCHIVTITL